MADRRLAVVVEEAAGFEESRPGARLLNIEEKIRSSEGDGITFRWESGQELLHLRRGKQLPKGKRKEMCALLRVSGPELNYRMAFAEMCPTRDEVSNALETFGSWRVIVSKALPKKPREPKPVSDRTKKLRETKALLKRLHGGDCNQADRAILDSIQEELSRIYDEMGEER